MKIKHLILVFIVGSAIHLNGQDFHNSFFQFAPMTINPALTGAFYGNLRANAIGRDQGRAITDGLGGKREFRDLSLGLDYNIDFGFTPNDWVSAGVNFSKSSNAGAGQFGRQFTGLSAAYHLAFGKNADKVFTVGLHYGTYTTGFKNVNNAHYRDPETVATGSSQDLNIFLDNQFGQQDAAVKSTSDYMLGFMLDAPLGKTADIRIGVAADHILKPRLSIPQQDSMNMGPIPPQDQLAEVLERRINAFVFLYTDINNRLTFNPNILFQTKGASTNIVVQALFNYLYSQEKQIGLIAGLGARLANSMDIPLYFAMDMKDLRVGLSYDLNISGLNQASNSFGAVELAVTKIFNWNKKATVKPVFICPRL